MKRNRIVLILSVKFSYILSGTIKSALLRLFIAVQVLYGHMQ